MNHSRVLEHQEISDLIPWVVNGTAAESDRQRVDEHVRSCAACRNELLNEQRLHRSIASDPGVEYMPAPSLRRLLNRLDAPLPETTVTQPGVAHPARRVAWPRFAAASVAAVTVAVALISADRWMRSASRDSPARYVTVTSAQVRPPEEVIRAVFTPTITLVELQSILDESELRIISGPTEAGVYSLASRSKRPVRSSLALLRAHPEVRFAESTTSSATGARTPGSGEPP
jgi:hypothetical protein